MFPRGYVDNVIGVLYVGSVQKGKRPCSHKPKYRPTCTYLELTIGPSVKKITVGFKVELVVLRDPNARYDVESGCMPLIPVFTHVAVAGSDTNIGA